MPSGAAIEARDLDGLGFQVEAGTVFGLLGPTAPASRPRSRSSPP